MANGWASMLEVESMFPDQVWDMCEQLDRLADSQAHDQSCRIPRPRKSAL